MVLGLALLALGCDEQAPPMDAGADAGVTAVPDAGAPPPFVEDDRWHRQVVFYELWVRSFQDSDGDGVGDLNGLTSRLDYLADLGIGGLWLMPIFPSPLADSGYDVADYVDIHPDYGTLEDFDAFVAAAHDRGLRVYLDLVFNHTSREHAWFQEARSNPTSPRADWFVWSDEAGVTCEGASGPFGEVRWTLDEARGQYYFHQFYPEQPDLNFDQPDMRAALLDAARFWLERGVDGFRLDVPYRYDEDLPVCVHRPGTFAFLRELRALTDEYDAAMVGEILASPTELADYLQDDVLQMGFLLAEATIFSVGATSENPSGLGRALDQLVEAVPPRGAFCPVLGNHDLPRTTAAVGDDPGALRVMAGTLLTLPGVPFVYYGEELGMRAGSDVIVDGRDSARTPMQWDGTANAGFTDGAPFLALAPEHEARNVEAELADPGSLLGYYRRLIALRNDTPALRTGTWLRVSTPRSVLAFFRHHPDGDRLVLANFARTPTDVSVAVPWSAAHEDVSDVDLAVADGALIAEVPPQTVWVLRPAD